MRKNTLALVASMAFLCGPRADGAGVTDPVLYASLSEGWRTFAVDWELADANGARSFRSRYQDQGAWMTRLAFGADFEHLAVRVEVEHGSILRGRSHDQSFASDGSESQHVDSDSDHGRLFGLNVALGVPVTVASGLRVQPELGWAIAEQHLVQRDGVQTVPSAATLSGLDNRYDAQWSGPWVGLGITWQLNGSWAIQGRANWQFAQFSSSGDLNLRDDLDHPHSFTQQARGWSASAALSLVWTVNRTWTITASGEMSESRASDGTDTLHLTDGNTIASTLDEVTLHATTLMLGLSARF